MPSHDPSPETTAAESRTLSRRGLLAAAGALATTAVGKAAFAAHHEHDHAAHAPKQPALLAALEACLAAGRLCTAHCLVAFGEGDTSLAACAARVREMEAICNAMATLVASNSALAGDLAKVCKQACEDCAAECRKHADMHAECRACMEACEKVVAAL